MYQEEPMLNDAEHQENDIVFSFDQTAYVVNAHTGIFNYQIQIFAYRGLEFHEIRDALLANPREFIEIDRTPEHLIIEIKQIRFTLENKEKIKTRENDQKLDELAYTLQQEKRIISGIKYDQEKMEQSLMHETQRINELSDNHKKLQQECQRNTEQHHQINQRLEKTERQNIQLRRKIRSLDSKYQSSQSLSKKKIVKQGKNNLQKSIIKQEKNYPENKIKEQEEEQEQEQEVRGDVGRKNFKDQGKATQLRKENQRLRTIIKNQNDGIKVLQRKIHEDQIKIRISNDQQSQLQMKLNHSMSQFQVSKQESEIYKQQNQKLMSENKKLEDQIRTSQQNFLRVKAIQMEQLIGVRNQNQEWKRRLNQLMSQVSNQNRELKTQNQKIRKLMSENKQLKDEVRKVEARNGLLYSENTRLNDCLKISQANVEHLQKQIQETVGKASKESGEYKSKISCLQQEFIKKSERIEQLQNQLNQKKQEVNSLTKKLNEFIKADEERKRKIIIKMKSFESDQDYNLRTVNGFKNNKMPSFRPLNPETQHNRPKLISSIQAIDSQKTISNQSIDLQQQKQNYHFSPTHKDKHIKIENNNTKASAIGWSEFALIDGVVLKKGSSIKFKFFSINKFFASVGVGVGLGIRNLIAGNQYELKNSDQTGHGCFLLFNDSYSYSHSHKEHNDVKTNFSFKSHDVIEVQTNGDELCFTNHTQNKEFKMKIKLTEEEWEQACFCVQLKSVGYAGYSIKII